MKRPAYQNATCVVTGVGGFLGSAIARTLTQLGACVYGIDDLSTGSIKNIEPEVRFITGDVRDGAIFEQIDTQSIDYFFHFAAPSSIGSFQHAPWESTDITIRGFLNAWHYAQLRNARFIYPSTGSLYSHMTPPHTESGIWNLSALNKYARAKAALELIAGAAFSSSMDAIGLRIFAGYGPGEWHKNNIASVVYLFCVAMAHGEKPLIFGDGLQKRDFVYIDDVVQSIVTLGRDATEPIINIGTGKNHSFNDVIGVINEVLGTDITPEYRAKPDAYLETTLCDTSLLSKYIDPGKTQLKDGVRAIIDSIRG